MILNFIFAALAVLSLALVFWQFLAARKFPLHQRIADPAFSPAVSLFKPLKGCDATTSDSLQSWFSQNYAGPVQILFGVASADDPVCDLVRELLKKNLNADAQLVICGEPLGANAKVSTLIQLEKLVKHDLVLTSDADVRVPTDFLANVVAPLRDPKIELVNCFYRLANPTTTAMQWEAIQVNADFWSGVLQSQTLKPQDFASGAAILVRRKSLDALGGFKALADCLADDYQIGNRVVKSGGKIALCPIVVDCWDAPMNWRQIWKHQLRWARTIRVCMPAGYFFSILCNGTLWPLLWFIVALVTAKTICAPLTAIAFVLIRIALAQNLQRRFLESRQKLAPFWLVPVKDLLQFALWAGAFCGNQIEWRGKKMRLRPNGDLEPIRQ
jgi:ceramide glucosyltransferase